jgi:hypothetical protein
MNTGKRIPTRIRASLILHPRRNPLRNHLPVHLLDPRKDNINPGTHPRRRPDIPISHPPRLRDPVDPRPQRGHLAPGHFIRRRAFPIQDARASGEARARADSNQMLQTRIDIADQADRSGDFRAGAAGSQAAGDEEDVERGRGGKGMRGNNGLTGCKRVSGRFGGHGVEGRGEDGQCYGVCPGEDVEGVERAEGVEGLEAGVDEDADVDYK